MGVPYQVLMPIFARDIFHGGPKTLGFLMAMSGVGALIGAMYLAGRKSVIGLGKIIASASALFGFGVVVFSFSGVLWFSMLVIFVAGFAMMVQMAASNTVLQTIVEEDKRGRIMSFYTMAFMGMTPFGSLLAGSLAHAIGAPYTLAFGGVCCIIAALIFVRKLPSIREKIRPIYIKKGIIPEVARGIGAASGQDVLSEK
jgi:MFS family permease